MKGIDFLIFIFTYLHKHTTFILHIRILIFQRHHKTLKQFTYFFITMKLFVFILFGALQMVSGSHNVIQKCCLKHEELHPNGRDCVLRSADRSPLANIETASKNELDIVSSLPEPFNLTDLRIKYEEVSQCQFNNFLLLNLNETSRYTLIGLKLYVNFTNISDGTFTKVFHETQYCLDTIQNKNDTRLIRVCTSNLSHAKKCCPEGKKLRRKGNNILECIKDRRPWSLQDSPLRNHTTGNTAKDVLANVISLCTPEIFNVTSPNYLNKNSSLHPNLFLNSNVSNFLMFEFVCVDHFNEFGKNSDSQEIVGVCHRSDAYLKPFFSVHHLCPVAALLLVLSIGCIMIRAELRKSLHGQALACHAAALLMASVLRAIWWYSRWFKPSYISQCNTLAYILSYFMVASSIWLNIICINTVIEIRHAESGGKMPQLRNILWYSVYGWVIPALHTLLVVLQPWQESESSKPKAHVFHTRTCFFKDDLSNHLKLEKFLYYYGPMTAILLVNIVLLIYSMMKCQDLQSSVTAMRGGERKVRPLSSKTVPEQALMYARLLISAGVGEMSAEIIAWALNDPQRHGPDGSRLTERHLLQLEVSEKEFTFWILATTFDFLRALSVFILCCLSRRTVRAVKHMWKGYVRLDRTPSVRLSWPFRRSQGGGRAQDNMLVMEPLTPPR